MILDLIVQLFVLALIVGLAAVAFFSVLNHRIASETDAPIRERYQTATDASRSYAIKQRRSRRQRQKTQKLRPTSTTTSSEEVFQVNPEDTLQGIEGQPF